MDGDQPKIVKTIKILIIVAVAVLVIGLLAMGIAALLA